MHGILVSLPQPRILVFDLASLGVLIIGARMCAEILATLYTQLSRMVPS